MNKLFRLIEFSDSAFPVGTFSFSNGLETAAHLGVVKDASTLESYTRSVARQAAQTDGVSAVLALRAARLNDYEAVCRIDRQLLLFKLNEEARLMLIRMGKKLAELAHRLYEQSSMIALWLEDINSDRTPGCYPVAQALLFAEEKMEERELFVAHQYGVINMVLSAALRCVRVSHYETQRILFAMADQIEDDYKRVSEMELENMNSFVPQMDIFASLHEKGHMRMFMN